MKKERLNNFINLMEENNVYQSIITSTPSVFYFLNEWIEPGERLLALYINLSGEIKLIINEMFKVTSVDKNLMLTYSDSDNPINILANVLIDGKTIGIDEKMQAGFLLELLNLRHSFSFKNISPLIAKLRMIKDDEEINYMKFSSEINDKTMGKVINVIPEMLSERLLAKAVKNIFEREGADNVSFEPIVAYGANSSNPHHVPDSTNIKDGDAVVLDIGCIKNHYCSDMTRTVFFGNPINTFKKIYEIVLEANLKAIDSVKPGVKACEVDKVAREVITKHGYGDYFIHRTGHGVGIEIHEMPYISSNSDVVLEPGMIISVEPGIYLPNIGGVRIEDLVLVTKKGCKILNHYPKDFTIV